MLRNTKTVKGFALNGLDESFGRVKDFYFDDQAWTIRYLVADTGSWMKDGRVLISPLAIGAIDGNEKYVRINLSRAQVQECPPLSTDKPVSRQYEQRYHSYYGWPMYWHGPGLWGPADDAAEAGTRSWTRPTETEPHPEGDPHLRSVAEVYNYHIQGRDGEIGHVEDFIFDEATWAIRYIEIDTVSWWPGKKVLIAPQWISNISWRESKVFVDLDRETIKQAPSYEKSRPITRGFEEQLHKHFLREPYWAGKDLAHSR